MANIKADNAAATAAGPQSRVKSNKQGGRVRWFESTYDAAVHGVASVADTIEFGTLPVGARVIGSMSSLNYGAGTASSTLAIGDTASAARHLAATAINAAGNTGLANPANGAASFETSDASGTATDNCKILGTVAGAATGAAQKITLRLAYVTD